MNKGPLKKRYGLRLYIAGQGPYADRAKQGLAEAALVAGIDYDLEIIDVCATPDRAIADHVVVTPTLIKLWPLPRAIVVGNLSDLDKTVTALRVGCRGSIERKTGLR